MYDGSRVGRSRVPALLPPGTTASFVVQGPWGAPVSDPASGTSPTRELMWVTNVAGSGLERDALAPQPAYAHFAEGGQLPDSLGVAVSPDHSRWALTEAVGLNEAGWSTKGLSRIVIGSPIAGAQVSDYTALDQKGGPLSDRAPAFSPDGKTLLFSRGATGTDPNRTLESLNLVTGALSPVNGSPKAATDPAFTPDGHAIVMINLSTPQPMLGVIYPQSGTGAVYAGTAGASSPSVSPDGKTIAFRLNGGIATLPLAGGAIHMLPGTTGTVDTTIDTTAGAPSWSADGTRIYYPMQNLIKAAPLSGADPVTVITGITAERLATPVEMATAIPAIRTTLTGTWTSTTLAYGGTATVHGQLTGASGQLGSRSIHVQFQAAGRTTWSAITTAMTDATGAFTATVKPTGTGSWRLVYEGAAGDGITTASWLASTSPGILVQVHTVLAARASASRVTHGATVTIAGTASPAEAGTVVWVQRWNGHTWTTIATLRENTVGQLTLRVHETTRGTFVYRLYKASTARIVGGASNQVTVTVR